MRYSPLLFSLVLLSGVVHGKSYPTESYTMAPDEFKQCLTRLSEEAQQSGIEAGFAQNVLADSQFMSNIIGYDRKQPEFSESFSNYFGKRVTLWRINKGRKLFQEHKALLGKLYQTHGVPPHYLIAFWGLETNFGSYKGKMPIIDALVTLACDQRRSTFFTEELLNALKLMEKEGIAKEQMLGSWAGAMGHTQFMPSAYLKYAIDGDGDGRADLWNSVPDALTSAANFLKHLGWKSGFRWGREVVVVDGLDYAATGLDVKKSLYE